MIGISISPELDLTSQTIYTIHHCFCQHAQEMQFLCLLPRNLLLDLEPVRVILVHVLALAKYTTRLAI